MAKFIDHDADGNILIWGLKLSEVIGIVGGVVGLGSGLWLWLSSFAPYDLQFVGPEQVELRCYPNEERADGLTYCNDASKVSLTAMLLSYINKGNPSKVPVVISETATVKLPRRTVTLHWHWFSNIGDESLGQMPVGLFSVPPEGLAHQTQFLGRIAAEGAQRYEDLYDWDDLMADVAGSRANNTPLTIDVSFQSAILGSARVYSAACSIELDPETIDLWLTPGNDVFQRRFTCKQANPL